MILWIEKLKCWWQRRRYVLAYNTQAGNLLAKGISEENARLMVVFFKFSDIEGNAIRDAVWDYSVKLTKHKMQVF